MGLDPGLGILHADQPNRDSLVYDLMEPVRPEVDAWLFRLFGERRFSRNDFFETPEGQIMLTKPLAHQLAQTLPLWARAIAPVVEETARHLLHRPGPRPYTPPTKLTQTHRSRASSRAHGGKRSSHGPRDHHRRPKVRSPAFTCPECGKPTTTSNRLCSPTCLERYRREVTVPNLIRGGLEALEKLRSENLDPAHGGEAAKKRGRSNRAWAEQRKAWDAAHSPAEDEQERRRFRAEILPFLDSVPLHRIAALTGLSLRYASLIRSGSHVPHPIHYPRLEQLAHKDPEPE